MTRTLETAKKNIERAMKSYWHFKSLGICTQCNVKKAKRGVYCLDCVEKRKVHSKIYYENSGKNASLKNLYGISLEDYKILLFEQGGVCAICASINLSGRALSVDHCHKKRIIRGLLCDNCNFALGQFKDNVNFLERALGYLKKYE